MTACVVYVAYLKYIVNSRSVLDPETGPQWLQTLLFFFHLLLLLLLLSDFSMY